VISFTLLSLHHGLTDSVLAKGHIPILQTELNTLGSSRLLGLSEFLNLWNGVHGKMGEEGHPHSCHQ